jgi:hypothetical protein
MTMWPDGFTTRYRIAKDTLILDLGTRMRVLSSAPRGGGLRTTRYIVNHQVPPILFGRRLTRSGNILPVTSSESRWIWEWIPIVSA